MKRALLLGSLGLLAACGASDRPAAAVPDAELLVEVGDRIVAPKLSLDRTRVAYWVPGDSGNVYTLYTANADFSDPSATRFTSSSYGQSLEWSPDGTQIAAGTPTGVVVYDLAAGTAADLYSEGGGLWQVVDWHPDGGALVMVETTQGGVVRAALVDVATRSSRPLVPEETRSHFGTYLPDGRGIVYLVIDQGKNTIWYADSSGGGRRALTTEGMEGWATRFPVSFRASLSPDGSEFLYLSRRTGRSDVFAVPIAGGPARQLTQDIRDDESAYWTPDGRSVVFLSGRGGQSDLWVVPREGGDATRITDSPEEEQVLGWDASGASLIFSMSDRRAGLVVHDLAAGVSRELVPDSARVRGTWLLSPDRRFVAAALEKARGVDDLLVTDLTTGESRTVVAGGGCVCTLAWSPDGRSIAMSSDRGGTLDVWTVDVASGALTQRTNWPSWEDSPVYSADGRSIIFGADQESRLTDLWRFPADSGQPTRLTTAGNFAGPLLRRGTSDVVTTVIRESDGAFAPVRITDAGAIIPLWTDRGTLDPIVVDPSGARLAAVRPLADGTGAVRILSMTGGDAREVLSENAYPLDFSPDGRSLLYRFMAGAAYDLGLLDLQTGERRTVIATPTTSERGAEFGADANTIIVRRERTTTRYLQVKGVAGGR